MFDPGDFPTDPTRIPYDEHAERDDYTHHTIHRDDNSRMSWNTDDDGDYIPGSGHQNDPLGNIFQWDKGEQDFRR
jgi:hypothetical protein